MTHLTRTIPWAFRWLGPPQRIFVSIRFVFCITFARSMNISDFAFPSCFPGARIDLIVEDNTVALALAECPARPYMELIKSGIPSNFEFEACSPCCLEALASFFHASFSHWVFRSQSHQGRGFGSAGDVVSEAPECETKNLGLL